MLILGCGGGDSAKGGDASVEAAGCVPTASTNPYCDPYPTANIGTKARAAAVRGDVIKDFVFQGFRNTNQGTPTVDTHAPVQVSMADFYDPKNEQYKLLCLSVVRAWCSWCNLEADDLVGIAGMLGTEGVVLVQALSEGETKGKAASLGDLEAWLPSHKAGSEASVNFGPRGPIDFTAVLDPEAAELGVFDPGMVTPLNLYIDVRTMEILAQGEGLSPTLKADIAGQLGWVEHNPPSYPVP